MTKFKKNRTYYLSNEVSDMFQNEREKLGINADKFLKKLLINYQKNNMDSTLNNIEGKVDRIYYILKHDDKED